LKDSQFRKELLSVLSVSEDHALPAKFYNRDLILKSLAEFDKLNKIESDQDYDFLANFDFLLSMSMISLYKDLSLGRIDPYKFYKPYYNIPFTHANSFNLFSVLNNPSTLMDTISSKVPSSMEYKALQKLYKQFSNFIASNKVLNYDTAQKESSIFNNKVVNQRMEMLGIFTRNTSSNFDSSFNINRVQYIKQTRKLFGLPTEGGINKEFVERVCIPANEIIDNVIVSMERERWFSEPDTGNFVVVNITEFMVYMHSDSVKSMKVCLGKSKSINYDERYKDYLKTKNPRARPIDSETPQIGSKVIEVILNPTWTVPNSIIGKEMYHQILKNPSYLTRRGFEVIKDGKVVSPGSVAWGKYKPYSVPVKIRQKAGSSNSLGALKFNFPNGHNIYMHDTPEKGKFSLTNRAVSHGCIRLNYPFVMAEFLLGLQGDSSLVDKFRLKMGLQPYDTALQVEDSLLKRIKNTESIRLENPIPIYIDYRTIVFEKDGSMRFVKDIYRKNKAVAKKLKS